MGNGFAPTEWPTTTGVGLLDPGATQVGSFNGRLVAAAADKGAGRGVWLSPAYVANSSGWGGLTSALRFGSADRLLENAVAWAAGPNAPCDIDVSGSTINENVGIGTTVGSFTTTDPDVGDSHTYTLVSGPGDSGNASFSVVGNQLLTNAAIDFESNSSFSVRVRSTDSTGLSYEESFTIDVTDLAETVEIDAAAFTAGNGHVTVLKAAGTGPNGEDQIVFQDGNGQPVGIPAHVIGNVAGINVTGRDDATPPK